LSDRTSSEAGDDNERLENVFHGVGQREKLADPDGISRENLRLRETCGAIESGATRSSTTPILQPKKEMKKRLRRSPDHADAMALLGHLALKQGISGAEVPKKPVKSTAELIAARQQPARYSTHQTGRYQGR